MFLDEIPPFEDFEAVYQLFSPSVVFEDLEENMYEPAPQLKPAKQAGMKSPEFENEVIRLAEQGETSEIIKLARARLQKPKGGAGKAHRRREMAQRPNAQGAWIVGMVKMVLEDLYPERRINERNERALEIAARMWNDEPDSPAASHRGMRVQISTLRAYIRKSSRRRLNGRRAVVSVS